MSEAIKGPRIFIKPSSESKPDSTTKTTSKPVTEFLLPITIEAEPDNLHIAGKVIKEGVNGKYKKTNVFISPKEPNFNPFDPQKLNEFMHGLDFSDYEVNYRDSKITLLGDMYLGMIHFSTKSESTTNNYNIVVYPNQSICDLAYQYAKGEARPEDVSTRINLDNLNSGKIGHEYLEKLNVSTQKS